MDNLLLWRRLVKVEDHGKVLVDAQTGSLSSLSIPHTGFVVKPVIMFFNV
jgi:hypothetical protein